MCLHTEEGQRHGSRWCLRRSRRSHHFKEHTDPECTSRALREEPRGRPQLPRQRHLELELADEHPERVLDVLDDLTRLFASGSAVYGQEASSHEHRRLYEERRALKFAAV